MGFHTEDWLIFLRLIILYSSTHSPCVLSSLKNKLDEKSKDQAIDTKRTDTEFCGYVFEVSTELRTKRDP